jgi:hypothetical protein
MTAPRQPICAVWVSFSDSQGAQLGEEQRAMIATRQRTCGRWVSFSDSETAHIGGEAR